MTARPSRALPFGAGAGVVAVIAAVALVTADGRAAAAAPARPRRVLVVSAPNLTWHDLEDRSLVNFRSFLDQGAIAALSTRAVAPATTPGDAYATIGAGGRARARATTAGTNVNANEVVGGRTGAELYAERTGWVLPPGDVGVLAVRAIAAQNDALPYDTVPGAFASALGRGGWYSVVVGNADQGDALHREVALAFADRSGRGGGRVDRGLLVADSAAPSGWRLDADAVTGALGAQWSDRTVAGVELSDLARADAAGYGRADALRSSDQLLGRLLTQVDPARDLVMLVAPYHPGDRPQLTVMAMRGPGVAPGWLVSGTTRRPGYVSITDIAPTVLERLAIARPHSMEGRAMHVEVASGSATDRVGALASANAHAMFRDDTIGAAVDVLAALTVLVALAAAWFLPRPGRGRRAVATAALAIPGTLLGTYLAMIFPVEQWGSASYWAVVVLVALGFTVGVELAARGDPWRRTLIAFGALGGFHAANQLIGAPLEINAVFGYTATVGVRVQGLGNQSYAQLAPCALIVAALFLVRPAARAGWSLALGTLAVALVVTAAPWWGSDLGGALADVLAFCVFCWIAAGRRVRVRTVLLAGAAAVVFGLLVGLADLARPVDQRSHIGRFFEKVADDGLGGLGTVVGRKAALMLGTFHNLVYVVALLVVIAVLGWLWRGRSSYGHELETAYPPTRALMTGLGVLALGGMLLNDSGVSVPAMMAMVVIAAVATLAPREPAARNDDDDAYLRPVYGPEIRT